MKFERLNESNGKGKTIFLCGLITGVGLLIIFNLFLTKAKYKVVDSAKLVNSTINYSSADFSLIAIYLQEGTNDNPLDTYKKVENDLIPTGKVLLNEEKSYCKVGEEELKGKEVYNKEGINIEVNNNTVDFTGIKQAGTKCYLYFDLMQPGNPDATLKILNLQVNNEEQGCPTTDANGYASITSTEKTKSLLCESKDDYGKTYYFRGVPTNNWVKIGEYYWQIVRINGNGSIRLIYNGKSTNRTASDTIITKVPFNTSADDNAYVGFKYGDINQSGENAYNKTHTNSTPSNIFNELKKFYEGNTIPINIKKYLDGEAGFCNDRTPYKYDETDQNSKPDTSQYGIGTAATHYGSLYRFRVTYKMTFKCPQIDKDLFTTKEAEKGNQALNIDGMDIPVGLITADEVTFAGSYKLEKNASYYLYNNQYYWTISPSLYMNGSNDYKANIFYVRNGGDGYLDATTGIGLSGNNGVRPVINLLSFTPLEEGGDGSTDHPFTVKLD